MDWFKGLIIFTVLLFVGIYGFIFLEVDASQEKGNLPSILDVCERPLQYPIGSIGEEQQSLEASELYKRGMC